jgi:hypothetical protein
MRGLVAAQPPAWEFQLYAGALGFFRDAVDEHYDLLRKGPIRTLRKPDDDSEAVRQFSAAPTDLQGLLSGFEAALDRDAQVRAFGEPGEPKDAEEIVTLAAGLVETHASFRGYAWGVRATDVSGGLARLREAAAALADEPAAQVSSFIDEFKDAVGLVPDRLAAGETVDLSAEVKLELSEAALQEYQQALREASGTG